MADPTQAQSLLQPGETLGPVTPPPAANPADANQGLLRPGESLGPVTPAPAAPQSTNPDEPGAVTKWANSPGGMAMSVPKAVTRWGESLVHAPVDIYHAAVNPPSTDEEKFLAANGVDTIHGHIPGALALPFWRLVGAPMSASMDKADQYEAMAKTEADPKVKKQLLDAAGSYRVGGMVPVVGPLAAQLAERGAYGAEGASKLGPGGTSGWQNKNSDLLGATTEGSLYALTPKISEEVGGLAKSGVKAGLNAGVDALPGVVSSTASKATSAVGKAVYETSKAGTKYIGIPLVKGAAAGAIEVGQDFVNDIGSTIKGKLSDLTDGKAADAVNALRTITDSVKDKLVSQGLTGERASEIANEISNRVRDEYTLWVNPPKSVSGGSFDADAAIDNAVKETLTGKRGTINPHSPEAMGKGVDPDTGHTTPIVNDGVGVGPSNQPLRTPLATLVDQEPWAKQLKPALTRGQTMGGDIERLERMARRNPNIGRIFQQGADDLLERGFTQMFRDAMQDKTLGSNARGIFKVAIDDIKQNGRFNIKKLLQGLNDGLGTNDTFKNYDVTNTFLDGKLVPQSEWQTVPDGFTKESWSQYKTKNWSSQLISDDTPRMKLLRDALEQAQKDTDASTRFGDTNLVQTAGTGVMATAKGMLRLLGGKWMVRTFFNNASEADEGNALIRMLANDPQISETGLKLKGAAKNAVKSEGLKDYTQTEYYKNLPQSDKLLLDRAAEKLGSRLQRIWAGRPTSMGGKAAQPPRKILPGQTKPVGPEWNISENSPAPLAGAADVLGREQTA